jgi:hypothetical protein
MFSCFLLRAKGFSCSLDVLYGGLGKSKLQFLTKNFIFFLAVNFLTFFSKPWTQIRNSIQPKTPDPDPKHCPDPTPSVIDVGKS